MISDIHLDQDIAKWLREDLPYWDISFIPTQDREVSGYIIAKDEGTVAGLKVAQRIFRLLGVEVTALVSDGDEVVKGDKVLEVTGPASAILQGERVALNIMCHMSAIASKTKRMVSRLRMEESQTRIAATRKTLPGLRTYQKWAVIIGGGDTHRLDLSSMALIKENHISTYGSVREAVRIVKESISFSHKIEIEVRNDEEAKEAAESGVDIIMLDNYAPADVSRVLPVIREVDSKVLIEASGGITEDNFIDYGRAGVDIISLGALTHSIKVFDMSLLLDEVN